MTQSVDQLVQAVTMIATVQEQCFRNNEAELIQKYKYPGAYRAILEMGKPFHEQAEKLPDGVKRGVIRECFMNASLGMNSRFVYCEGIAAGIIPVLHAWLLDLKTLKVVEPTWPDHIKDRAYYGIAFNQAWMRKLMVKTEYYGVFNDCHPEMDIFLREGLPQDAYHVEAMALLTLHDEGVKRTQDDQ